MSISSDPLAKERWRDIRRLTDRSSSYASPYFEPGEENMRSVHSVRILVVGAGGLGCELLKDLALSGFKSIDVIDMDTIDLSNLNRQFLFRVADVGKSKAEVAAKFVSNRVQGCTVNAHNCKIQDKDMEFYRQFHIIICGLDSVSARRWLNGMMCDLVECNEDGTVDESTVIPLIDGGTEGFKGNARVITPRYNNSPCIDCLLDLYPPQVNFPMCTIANTPRLPEHCVEYVKLIVWPNEAPFNRVELDADNPEHVDWVFKKSEKRAHDYGIRGVDKRLTQGVLKRIIPAVASTNAVIAASCALEALKLASNIACPLNNYLNFTDTDGAYCNVVSFEKNPNCFTCSGSKPYLPCKRSDAFSEVLEKLESQFQLKNPTVKTSGRTLYWISDFVSDSVVEQSKINLEKTFSELVKDREELMVVDEVLRKPLTFIVQFTEEQ